MQWFDVDKQGLSKILEGKAFVLFELVSNAWDENASEVGTRLGGQAAALALESPQVFGRRASRHDRTPAGAAA